LAQFSILIFANIAAVFFSISKNEKIGGKIFAAILNFLLTILIFKFSDDFFRALPNNLKFFGMLPAIFWGTGAAFSVQKTRSIFSPIAGFLILFALNLLFFENFGKYIFKKELLFVPTISLFSILAGNFAVLFNFFRPKIFSEKTQKIFTILILALSTILILFFGAEFLREPARTIFWILSAAAALFFGMHQNWPQFRFFGIGFFLLIIAKLFFFDIWELAIWVRFFAFLSLGAALLLISFFYQKQKK